MIVQTICNSGNDEYYTPRYAITPLLKYLNRGGVIWCPFDTAESNYVKLLQENGYEVIHSHINEGKDFFDASVPNCDYIISNPPYSVKTQVFERLFEIGKPFAMLVGVVGLFESQRRFNMFRLNKFEIMYFNLRVSYFDDNRNFKSPPFSSVYVCHNILPKQIVFETIEKTSV